MNDKNNHGEFSESQLEELARQWIEAIRHKLDSESDLGQAVVALNFTAPPEVQWRFILIALSLAESDDELDAVAAGPIEHLLESQGESYIAVVENEEATNPKFSRALTVRKYRIKDDVWLRVQALQKEVSEPLSSVVNMTAQMNSPVYKTWMGVHDKEKKEGFNRLSDEEKTFSYVYLLELGKMCSWMVLLKAA